jgi:hypothetical protein
MIVRAHILGQFAPRGDALIAQGDLKVLSGDIDSHQIFEISD